MLMVIPNEGKLWWLVRAVDSGTQPDFVIELYQNDYTPDDDTEIGDFDPADFDGYFPAVIGGGSWTAPVIVDDVAESEGLPTPVYSCEGGEQTVYGWFMYPDGDTTVVAAQRFDTPRVMVLGSVEALDPFIMRLKTFAICP